MSSAVYWSCFEAHSKLGVNFYATNLEDLVMVMAAIGNRWSQLDLV